MICAFIVYITVVAMLLTSHTLRPLCCLAFHCGCAHARTEVMTTFFILCCCLCILNIIDKVYSFKLSSKGIKFQSWRPRSILAHYDSNTHEVKSSLDIIEKHLVEKTSVLAVFPKLAFPASKIEKIRGTLANEHTWNSFLRKDQLIKLVSGKYWCPVLEHATEDNWCIFLEDRLQEKQYKRLTTLIAQEYDTSPYPVDLQGQPVPETRPRHKFMFCKKYHMIVIDGTEKASISSALDEDATAVGKKEAGEDWEESELIVDDAG